MRKISIYTTGGKAKEFQSSATTLTELQADFAKQGVSYSGMKIINGNDKKTLEHPEASIDQGDVKIFLYPQKTKSGLSKKEVDALANNEIRPVVKSAFEHDKLKANGHFNKDKNYTNKTGDVLRELLISYKGKVDLPSGSASTPVKETKKADTKTVAKVAPAKGKTNVADLVKSVSKAATSKTTAVPAKIKETTTPATDSTVDLSALKSILASVDALREKVLALFPKQLPEKAESLSEESDADVMKEFRAIGARIPGVNI